MGKEVPPHADRGDLLFGEENIKMCVEGGIVGGKEDSSLTNKRKNKRVNTSVHEFHFLVRSFSVMDILFFFTLTP